MTVTAAVDGVRVTKTFETDEFPVPTVTFEVVSERDDPVTVRVVDVIPEDFEMDHVGFHPDYGSENWTAYPDQRVEFQRALDPGETVRTVYGVRLDDPGDGERFMGEPELSVDAAGTFATDAAGADPVEETTIADIAPREGTDVVRDVAAGDADTVPGMEADALAGMDADDGPGTRSDALAGLEADDGRGVESDAVPGQEADDDAAIDGDPLGLQEHETATDDDWSEAADDPARGEAADQTADEEAGEASGAAEETGGVMPGNLAAALAAEFEAGDVDDEHQEAIASAVGARRSREVEMEHLQARVSELEAYADALEAFIDENGTATELLSDVETDVESLERRVSGLSEEVAENGAAREELADRVDSLSAEVATVESVASDVEALRADVDGLRGDLEAIDERVAGVEADVAETSDAEEAVADVADDVAAVRETVEGVADDVEDVKGDVRELQEWREDLSSVLGGS